MREGQPALWEKGMTPELPSYSRGFVNNLQGKFLISASLSKRKALPVINALPGIKPRRKKKPAFFPDYLSLKQI